MHKRRSSSAVRRRPCAEAGPAGVLQRCETMPVCLKHVWNAFDMRKGPGRSESGRGPQTLEKTLLRKGLAELSRPQTTEGKEAPSFPATCASEMTPLMTDRATFLPESSPVRHASLCRKRPKAFFDRLNSPRLCRGLFACLSKNVYQMSTIGTFKPEKPTFFVLTYHSPYKIRSARRVILLCKYL